MRLIIVKVKNYCAIEIQLLRQRLHKRKTFGLFQLFFIVYQFSQKTKHLLLFHSCRIYKRSQQRVVKTRTDSRKTKFLKNFVVFEKLLSN